MSKSVGSSSKNSGGSISISTAFSDESLIHFVGDWRLRIGCEVSGSDIAWSSFVDGLQEAGALLHTGHSVANIHGSGASRLPKAAFVCNVRRSSCVNTSLLIEVSAVIQAARPRFPVKSPMVVFQPHMYRYPAAMKDDFANALRGADQAVVTEVCCLDTQFYAAREIDVQDVGGRELAATVIGPPSECIPSLGVEKQSNPFVTALSYAVNLVRWRSNYRKKIVWRKQKLRLG
ncbi:hypothetical protein ACFXTH_042025 [Malus domestica]